MLLKHPSNAILCNTCVYLLKRILFQGDTSIVVLIVPCFGVDFFVLFARYVRFHILVLCSSILLSHHWKIAAHSAYDMVSLY